MGHRAEAKRTPQPFALYTQSQALKRGATPRKCGSSRKDDSALRRYFREKGGIGYRKKESRSGLDQDPLGAALDELVHEHAQIGQDEAADVETEELGGVTGAEFETDVGRRR